MHILYGSRMIHPPGPVATGEGGEVLPGLASRTFRVGMDYKPRTAEVQGSEAGESGQVGQARRVDAGAVLHSQGS